MDEAGTSNPDWQLGFRKTRERLGHLLKTKLWADCTFLVGDDEKEKISAHKFVLAMSSPVFDTMFNGSMPEGKVDIRVPDVQPEAFRTMLKFLYMDKATLNTYQEASEVYCAARKYMLPFIQEECISYLEWKLTPSNACFAHEFATLFEENALLTASLKIFKRKTKEVLTEGSFYETHINTVAALFALNELDIETELDLFKALEKYTSETMGLKKLKRPYNGRDSGSPSKKPRIENTTEADCEDKSCEQTEDEKRLLAEVRQAVSHIRFLTLSAQQFATHAQSMLLTDEEAFAVMMNIVGVPVPIPAAICSNRESRCIRQWSPDYSGAWAASTSTSQRGPGQSPKTPAKANVYESICSFKVLNFKTRKRAVKSNPFHTDNLEWRVNLVPGMEKQPNGEEQEIVGVHVECTSRDNPWSCSAHVSIELLSEHEEGLKRAFTNPYNKNATTYGYRNLVPWTVACNNFLRLNTLTIEVRVQATIPQQ